LLTYLLTERKADSSAPTDDANDMFDVAIDEAAQGQKRGNGEGGTRSQKRQKKDAKFGFGGDATSSGDLSNFSAKKMKSGAKRPGKSKRNAAKGRN
jgi:rRNA-processing protein EBP2